ncbi:MAG: DUF6458 family protein [Solirubrobacteraceae bacterium]
MTIGSAIALIAVGAILHWAVTAHVSWIDLQTTGTVLFIVGLVGLVLALAWTFWPSRRASDDETRIMRPPPGTP